MVARRVWRDIHLSLGMGSVTPFLQFLWCGGSLLSAPKVYTWGWLVFGDPQMFVEVALGHPPVQALPWLWIELWIRALAAMIEPQAPPVPPSFGVAEKEDVPRPAKVTFSKFCTIFWGVLKIPCPRKRSCRGESKVGDY